MSIVFCIMFGPVEIKNLCILDFCSVPIKKKKNWTLIVIRLHALYFYYRERQDKLSRRLLLREDFFLKNKTQHLL